jgi:hypothetical protein
MIDKMRDITEFIREEITWAQALQQEYANRKRLPAPVYEAGDEVWLDARNIRTQRPSKKLDWKNLGPYQIAKRISSHAYRLDLPESMKIHPVFHVSLLRPAPRPDDHIPGQNVPPPEPVVVDNEEEYFVDSIEGLRYNRRSKIYEYHIKWTGYNELTWEPALNLKDNAAVAAFYKRFPNIHKPKFL